MRIKPAETTYVLIPSRVARVIEVPAGATFASPGAERQTFTDRDAALAALAECPPPYPSWQVDPDEMAYVAPVPEPAHGDWSWDEAGLQWVEAPYDE